MTGLNNGHQAKTRRHRATPTSSLIFTTPAWPPAAPKTSGEPAAPAGAPAAGVRYPWARRSAVRFGIAQPPERFGHESQCRGQLGKDQAGDRLPLRWQHGIVVGRLAGAEGCGRAQRRRDRSTRATERGPDRARPRGHTPRASEGLVACTPRSEATTTHPGNALGACRLIPVSGPPERPSRRPKQTQ